MGQLLTKLCPCFGREVKTEVVKEFVKEDTQQYDFDVLSTCELSTPIKYYILNARRYHNM